MHPTTQLYDSIEIAYSFFNGRLFDNQLPQVIFTFQRKAGTMGFFSPDRWGNLDGSECHEIAMNPSYVANSRLIEVMKTLVHEMCHCWQYSYGSPGRDYYHNKEWAMKMIKVGLMPSSTGEPGGSITGQNMSDYIIDDGEFLKAFSELKEQNKFQLIWIDKLALPKLHEPVIASVDDNQVDAEDLSENDENIIRLTTIDPETKQKEDRLIKPYRVDIDEPRYIDDMPNLFSIQEPAARKTRHRYVCKCVNRVYGKPGLNITCDDCGYKFEWVEYENKKDP